MLSFTQLVIIYSLVFIALYFIIGYLEKKLAINDPVKMNKYLGKALVTVAITVVMLLSTLYWIENPSSYSNPDTYAYRKGIDIVDSSSQLPGEGSYDPYYVPFPIYVLIGAVVAITTDLSSSFSLIISQSAFTLLLLIILLRLLNGRWEMFIIITLLILSNPYLSGYLKILIPQVAGLTVLSLLLLLTLNVNRGNWLIISTILLPLGLIHFAVFPLLVTILSIYLILEKTIVRTNVYKGASEKNSYMYAITLLSILIHSIYIGYTYNVYNLTGYINYYLYLLTKIFTKPSEAIQDVLGGAGLPREYLILNALGPATFSAVTLYYLFSVIRNFRSKAMELTLYLLGIIIVGIGISRYYFATEIPSGSIARYLNVYGFLLLTFAITLVFSKTKTNRLFYYTLLATLIFGALGSMLDPLSLPYKLRNIQTVNLDIISNYITGHLQCVYITLQYYTAPYLSSSSSVEIPCLKGLDSNVDLYELSKNVSIIYSSVKSIVFTLNNYIMIYVKS